MRTGITWKAVVLTAFMFTSGCTVVSPLALNDNCIRVDGSGYRLDTEQGIVSALIEIPAGTRQKWEVDHSSFSQLCWEQQGDSWRIINYLGYPTNYGAIPGTLSATEDGGDGDPLDILVLGDPLARGAMPEVYILGMLSMQDGGEDDHKLIGKVVGDYTFAGIDDLASLQRQMPELTTILQLWFANYKGTEGDVSGLELHDRAHALEEIRRSLL